MQLDRQFISQVVPEAKIFGQDVSDITFSVDSRTLQQGECFVALRGSRVDGHDYIKEAIQNGARAVMVLASRIAVLDTLRQEERDRLLVIAVSDTYAALLALARVWRQQFSIPVVGITGSVGKTSTKELLYEMVRASGKQCLASSGNLNTAIGISLSILQLRKHHEVALFEMGINKRGEMAVLAEIARPTTAVITTIGHSHMEGLGSLNDIAAEKRDIFKYFKEDNIGIINGDQAILSQVSYQHPIVRFGTKTVNQFQARKIQAHGSKIDFVLKLYNNKYKVTLPTNHHGRITQAIAAASAAYLLGIPAQIIVSVLQKPLIVKGRFERRKIKQYDAAVIDDCYNANPESMKAALLAFEKLEAHGNKIAVLGDMLELGVNSAFWHRQIGRFLHKTPSITRVIFVGEQVKSAYETLASLALPVNCHIVPTWQSAAELLQQQMQSGSLVLIKGSRGMNLNQLVEQICE